MSDLEIRYFIVCGVVSLVVIGITYVRGKVLQGAVVGAFGLAFIWSLLSAMLEASRTTKSDAPIPDGFIEVLCGLAGFVVGGVAGALAGTIRPIFRSRSK